MARVPNISRVDANKKEAGMIAKSMAVVWRIKLVVIDMKDNMKMT